MHAEELPEPHTSMTEIGSDDPCCSELEDTLQTFVLLAADCLTLSRAMLEGAPPGADVDHLERVRRERLVRKLEVIVGDSALSPWGGGGQAC